MPEGWVPVAEGGVPVTEGEVPVVPPPPPSHAASVAKRNSIEIPVNLLFTIFSFKQGEHAVESLRPPDPCVRNEPFAQVLGRGHNVPPPLGLLMYDRGGPMSVH